jgi:succinyl-diaminopimelate desuccinylase
LIHDEVFKDPRFVLALDAGREDRIVSAQKGVAHIKLNATGKQQHNCEPWLGVNAIDAILQTYTNLQNLIQTSDLSGGRWYNTVSIGNIEGGDAVNQIPAAASAEIDIRFTDEFTLDYIKKKIKSSLVSGVEMEHCLGGEHFVTDESDPIVQTYARSMNEALGTDVEFMRENGATDGAFFKPFGCPILLHNPNGGGAHTNDEWVDIQSMDTVYKGLTTFFDSVLNKS